jgi:phage terminase large subunit
MGVEDAFIIEKASITCKATGSEFIFAGINKDSVDNIKSISYIDITFIDEAEAIQKDTWKILLPTVIREADSKLIISFNPRMAKSYTYQFFVVNPPPNSRVTKINYIDNPFCSQQAKELAEAAQLSDPDEYINVWLGEPVYNLENAVYAKELRRMVENERFRRVDYIKTVPCDTFWDLGRSDFTSIIIAQIVAGEYRIIDCVETQGKIAIDHIQILRDKGYIYNTWWLPHDAEHKTTAARLTIKEQIMAQSKGICQSVRIVPNIRVLDGINAARTIFDNCYFDEKRCELLVNHLREYQWDTRKEKLTPLHDEHSHMSDAWRYLAVALKPPKPPAPTENEDQFYRSIKQKSGNGWMRG